MPEDVQLTPEQLVALRRPKVRAVAVLVDRYMPPDNLLTSQLSGKMITVRMPAWQHLAICEAAEQAKMSVNRFILDRLGFDVAEPDTNPRGRKPDKKLLSVMADPDAAVVPADLSSEPPVASSAIASPVESAQVTEQAPRVPKNPEWNSFYLKTRLWSGRVATPESWLSLIGTYPGGEQVLLDAGLRTDVTAADMYEIPAPSGDSPSLRSMFAIYGMHELCRQAKEKLPKS